MSRPCTFVALMVYLALLLNSFTRSCPLSPRVVCIVVVCACGGSLCSEIARSEIALFPQGL